MTPPNAMAEFFERLGERIVRSPSACWHEVQPGVILSFPYHRLITPDTSELRALFRTHRLRAVRFPTLTSAFGFHSTLELNTRSDYDLKHLAPTARRQTKQGLAACQVRTLDFDELERAGLPLARQTAQRQNLDTAYADPHYWRRFCRAGAAVPDAHAWGAFCDGTLAAFLVSVNVDDWVNCIYTASSRDHLDRRPNNALLFAASRRFLVEEKKRICYGLGSLEHLPQLDHFKRQMGWTLQPIKQRLVFSRLLGSAFSLAREPVLRGMERLLPRSYTVRKVAGMIRLHRQQTFDPPPAAESAAENDSGSHDA